MPRIIDQRLISAKIKHHNRIRNKWYELFEKKGLRYEVAMNIMIDTFALSESRIAQIVNGKVTKMACAV